MFIYSSNNFIIIFITSPYNLLFVFGVFSAYIYAKFNENLINALFLIGLTGIIIVGLSEVYFFAWSLSARTVAYGLSATLLVIALARQEQSLPGTLVLLGNASYAIYLVHLPVMNFFAIIVARTGSQHFVAPLVMFGLLSVVAVLAGTVFHLVIERPLLARFAGSRRRAPALRLNPKGQ